MKTNKLSNIAKGCLLAAAIILAASIKFPIWRIELNAPQYPEGLALEIHANDIKGDVDIINGLNHYIGMKTLHKEDFIEFTVLPYLIIGFAALFLITLLINRKKFLYFTLGLFVVFGIIAMIDFWRWEYNYGHNLNPDAAIKVPGMAYQPPLIGYKQLLNFAAYSIPDIGGWMFIGSGLLVVLATFWGWKKTSKIPNINAMLILLTVLSISSCTSKVDDIQLGRDYCEFCKMKISDERFGAAILSKKGKTIKFDDIACMKEFIKAGEIEKSNIKEMYLTDFSNNHTLIQATHAFLLKSETFSTPMEGNTAAFSSEDSMKKIMNESGGNIVNWNGFIQ